MIVSKADLDAIQSHWAVAAISADDRSRAFDLAKERLVICATGHEIEFEEKEESNEERSDDRLLSRVALAYEIATIEGFDALCRSDSEDDSLRRQSAAASYKAFDIRRLAKIPKGTDERIFHVLKLSALAYCGGRGSDMRRWFEDNPSAIEIPSITDASWDHHLLYRLFDCWIRLFRKYDWNDLNHINEIIADFLKNQDSYEEACLARKTGSNAQIIALRLVSLYHWARATEIFAEYMLKGKSQTIFDDLDQSFGLGIEAATASGDMRHEMTLRWLRAVSGVMVADSLWWKMRSVIPRISDFVRVPTKGVHQIAYEQNIIESTNAEIAMSMNISDSRTSLVRDYILQTLNQFHSDNEWVTYIAPTREIVVQIKERLHREIEPVRLRIEQMSGTADVGDLENDILRQGGLLLDNLVMTPNEFSLTISNISNEIAVQSPYLVVMDETYSIENEMRDIRIKHILGEIRSNCPRTNFLLLMPSFENNELLNRWLVRNIDTDDSISSISISVDQSEQAEWMFEYETLTSAENFINSQNDYQVDKPICIYFEKN